MRNIQQSGMIYGKAVNLHQISKPAAKKLFEAGKLIYMQSSNFMPIGCWSNATPTSKELHGETFEQAVNSFEYYNCSSEQGMYTNFYQDTNERAEQ